jgi:hypothetical protein
LSRLGKTTGELPTCRGAHASRMGRTARAVSPSLIYEKRLEIRLADYVYLSSVAANRALESLGGEAEAACRARLFVREAHRHYRLGAIRLVAPATVRAGDAARGSEIIIPATYKGHQFHFHLDTVAAQQGRVIALFGTLAGTSTLGYDIRAARVLTKIAEAMQARQTARSSSRAPIASAKG